MQSISEYCWTVWLLKWRLLHLRSLSSNVNSRLFLQSSFRPRVSFFVALTIWSRFKDVRRTSKSPCWRVVRMQKLCAQVHVPCLVSYMRKLISTSEKTLKVSIVSSTIPTQHSPYSSTASRQTMNFFTQFSLLYHLLPSAIALTLSAPSNATIPVQSNYQCFTSPQGYQPRASRPTFPDCKATIQQLPDKGAEIGRFHTGGATDDYKLPFDTATGTCKVGVDLVNAAGEEDSMWGEIRLRAGWLNFACVGTGFYGGYTYVF